MNNFAYNPENLLERQFHSILDDRVFNQNVHIVHSEKLGVITFEAVLFIFYVLKLYNYTSISKIVQTLIEAKHKKFNLIEDYDTVNIYSKGFPKFILNPTVLEKSNKA